MASKWCGFRAFRFYLILLNVFYIAISIFLIALVVIARTFAYQISSVYVVIGVAVIASILFALAVIGIAAAVRHHQVLLFFYMIMLALCGILLFVVSVAALAAPPDLQETVLTNTWRSLSLNEKTNVQNSLNCCGFDNDTRHIVDKGFASDCSAGHPFCNTSTLFENCCDRHNVSAVWPPSPNTTYDKCLLEDQCPHCNSCYSSWESTITAGVKATGSFGLVFSFTQVFGILLAFRYRNLKDPYANPGEYL